MINTNIITGLKPHNQISLSDISSSYFVAIKDIEQKSECNQDCIEFTLCQIYKPLQDLTNEYDNIDKKLTISGSVESDNNGLYYTKLIGYESRVKNSNDTEEEYEENSHHIEILETKLSKEIDIDFSEQYSEGIPSVIVNIEKKYENLYKEYSTEYKKDENDNYTGVVISFKNLKTKKNYPFIKITIIGDSNSNAEESD